MDTKWKLELFGHNSIDLIHCQLEDDSLHLSTYRKFDASNNEYFWISTKYGYLRSLDKNYTNLKCPNCGELVPEYILLQLKLYTGLNL